MEDILVTTTNSLDGWKIKKYIGPVSAHIVIGTNVFKDFASAFTDFWGGHSRSYERTISSMYAEAIEQLKNKAYDIRGNCIIGLKVDVDEISGKGKDMFMITAVGTAVAAENMDPQYEKDFSKKVDMVRADDVAILHQKKLAIAAAEENRLEMSDDTWAFITKNKVHEVFPYVLIKWRTSFDWSRDDKPQYDQFYRNLLAYVNSWNNNVKLSIIYDTLIKENKNLINPVSSLIGDLRLLNLELVKQKLESSDFDTQKRMLIPLFYDKPFYVTHDIRALEEIKTIIENTFRERGTWSTKKQLFSSKEKDVWNCECGKQNNNNEYCDNCYKDIYGFNRTEAKPKEAIECINAKIELISEILGTDNIS